MVRRLNFERGDSAAVIILNTDSNKVVLVNQFRYPTHEKGPGWITEVVAGMLNDGEAPDQAIRGEISEETGYRVNSLIPIATFSMSPGRSSERIHLFYAEVNDTLKVSDGEGVAAEGENIKREEFSMHELWDAFKSGKIIDAKTIIALMWLKLRKEGFNG